ncbi:MAG: hypothetical protein JXB03_06235 [Spirochaetales bacterium]|nr:hypothetical protein [Spirochaetales bacterium]
MVEGFKKRKKYVVDRRFQFRMISSFLMSVLIALCIFTLCISIYYWAATMAGENMFKEFITIDRQVIEEREVDVNGETVMQQVSSTKTEAGVKRWELVLPPIIINNLIIILVISVLGLRYSHRIAGPAYRMKEDIKRVLDDGESMQIQLRKNDKLQELVGEVNRLIAEYDKLRNASG